MNHDLMMTGYNTGSGQDSNRLRAHLERLEDLARHASPIDQLRLKYTIQLVTVAIEAVDNARQATQRAVQRQRIEETMMAEVIAMNQEMDLLKDLYLMDADISK